MTKVDVYSGFLGAGKTTLIKKLIKEAYAGEKLVLIENEFGEIGIDGGFLQEAGITINEMNSGCICCSLQGDFRKALQKVVAEYAPDRIIIEPTGVGALSTVVQAVIDADADLKINGLTAVVDAGKCKKYLKNFGEFYNDQIQTASVVILSRTQILPAETVEDCVEIIKMKNENATVITADWNELTGKQILEVIEGRKPVMAELEALLEEHEECDDPDCSCHDHDHDEHEHHHHDHDEHEHHHHDHDHECDGPDCDCHDHEHHHHHHADEVFTSWGRETAKTFTEEGIKKILEALEDDSLGMVLRAKGIVQDEDGSWIHFDYTPGESEIRKGAAVPTGLLCVIGSKIDEEKIAALFGVH